MKRITLTRGQYALVDNEDFAFLNQWKWFAHGNRYAARRKPGPKGVNKLFIMHRQILDAPRGMDVDHINGDGFDNRKENLRLCTHKENCRNNRLSSRNTSGYKGVSQHSATRWKAYIRADRRLIYLGLYKTREEAAKVYNEAAVRYHGKYARLNET